MKVFQQRESNVRAYCRDYPVVFDRAVNAKLYDVDNNEYIDFLAGAGALNYGHNNQYIKEKLIDYINADSISMGLDLYTKAKEEFIYSFNEYILKPRDLDYKLQFCGPTGTNAVEASLKLARKVKQRTGIFAFMGGYHGMTIGSLSASGNLRNRKGAGLPLVNTTFIPYDDNNYSIDSINYIESILGDTHSGIENPAAIIVETVQGEGGVNIASIQWLKNLSELCTRHDILLICDDIQAGCGRCGTFFSFERAGIVPDIILLSKSISGYGLPMSLLLMKPELDIWSPGEHNGTFRGNQLAFVAGTAAIDFWQDSSLLDEIAIKEQIIKDTLINITEIDVKIKVRGIGMIHAIDFHNINNYKLLSNIISECFENGLIVESCGRGNNVIKLIPPLTIEVETLEKGLDILVSAIKSNLDL